MCGCTAPWCAVSSECSAVTAREKGAKHLSRHEEEKAGDSLPEPCAKQESCTQLVLVQGRGVFLRGASGLS